MNPKLTYTKDVGGFKRGTGLLVIEVRNSNPNGDPDRDSDPRQRPDQRGEISPVSFKRKTRDLVEWKGEVWDALAGDLGLTAGRFEILESRGRKREVIAKELTGDGSTFINKYWDARVFGNTFLESMKEKEAKEKHNFSDEEIDQFKKNAIRTGCVHFGLGLTVSPIDIERHTNTNKSGVQDGKDRGYAPMGYRFVPHGLYLMPFFVNPSAAARTGCTGEDIALLLELIRYAYPHTRSHARPAVDLARAWYVEHSDKLGSCSDFAILDALSPTKLADPESPSKSIAEYLLPNALPAELADKKDRHGNPALTLIDLL